MKALHTELKDIRIERGITLEDIYRTTKIRISFLERIEEGDFSVAPELFVRAFLREYAEAVGVDPGRVMARLDGKAILLVGDGDVRDEPPGETVGTQPAAETVPTPPSPAPAMTETALETPPAPPAASMPTVPSVDAAPPASVVQSPEISLPAGPKPGLAEDESVDTGREQRQDVRTAGGFFPEEEPKSPRALIFGFFFLVIVIATLVILYLNDIIAINF